MKVCAALVLGLALSGSTFAEDAPKPDNSRKNEVHHGEAAKTPIDQNENKSDIEITAKIRKAVVADKNLSTYAHNVKIITADGKVTLKGPVRSVVEKTAVEAKAEEVAGAANVTSYLEVAHKDGKVENTTTTTTTTETREAR